MTAPSHLKKRFLSKHVEELKKQKPDNFILFLSPRVISKLVVSICLGGRLLTSQGAIKQLNLLKRADFVNSPHKDTNTRNDVIRLFSLMSHTLINLHPSLKMSWIKQKEKKSQTNALNKASAHICSQKQTIWAVWCGEAFTDKQIEHCEEITCWKIAEQQNPIWQSADVTAVSTNE